MVHNSTEVNLSFSRHLCLSRISHRPPRKLGFIFDINLNFRQHISQTCCFHHFRDLRRIRRYMYVAVAITISNTLVSGALDYCNSIYRNTHLKDILKLQRVQHCLAMLVTLSLLFSLSLQFIRSILSDVALLFYICTLTCQTLSSKQQDSSYNFDHLIIIYLMFQVLRQMSELWIVGISAHTLWSSLPDSIMHVGQITFPRKLKKHHRQLVYAPYLSSIPTQLFTTGTPIDCELLNPFCFDAL